MTSTTRIPVRKDQPGTYGTRESRGEVAYTSNRSLLDSLASAAAADRVRLDSALTAANAASLRADDAARSAAAVQDSLRVVRDELSTTNARAAALAMALNDSIARLGSSVRRIDNRWRNGSIFGHSGLYVGLGTGANFTTGTLRDIGYDQGLDVVVPIGWHKQGNAIGLLGELGMQMFDGRQVGNFVDPNPTAYSAVGMLTLHLPLNNARTNNFYLMGGAGAYRFQDLASGSLGSGASQTTTTSNVTKLGVTGGAGLNLHVVGVTSLFIQSRLTNVFADASITGGIGSKSLRWVPLVAGITLR
ncbi:MAG: hypothetical protein Q8K82_24795 [Gemmatimonadaceae bacterium]|nr:hypothetical protein [Gemmatimonadaceae bacterium]